MCDKPSQDTVRDDDHERNKCTNSQSAALPPQDDTLQGNNFDINSNQQSSLPTTGNEATTKTPPTPTTTTTSATTTTPGKDAFICGVVEGFYGRPWTCDQRKDLFKRLKDMGLNTFMYGPKDDAKHRAKWRQLYNECEARELGSLINEAKARGIDFYYSLSPGLDMTYSEAGELELLKRKYEQLASLGCECFAILFDDIEPTINDKDKKIFSDYGSAQVSVANMIFAHLGRPKFLFCPTEYCESRAVPNVAQSVYLNTIGAGLEPDIDIMWTGSRVISRLISEHSIDELSSSIRRRPVIWENLHANDYDKKRVYLGPYAGRSTKIIPKLRGVLTNPNCEYEANYIAIHTLSQWARCTLDSSPHNQSPPNCLRAGVGPAGSSLGAGGQFGDRVYNPEQALALAIRDWLPELRESKSISSVEVCAATRRNDQVANEQLKADAKLANEEDVNVEMDSADTPPKPTNGDAPTNSAAGANIVDTNSCDSCEMADATTAASQPTAPTTPAPTPTTTTPMTTTSTAPNATNTTSTTTTTTSTTTGNPNETSTADDHQAKGLEPLNANSLSLLTNLFYLPFGHGPLGCALISDIRWLRENSDALLREETPTRMVIQADEQRAQDVNRDGEAPMCDEEVAPASPGGGGCALADNWRSRANRLESLCGQIEQLVETLLYHCPNKMLVVDLYPYLIDLRDLTALIKDYLEFLRNQRRPSDDSFKPPGEQASLVDAGSAPKKNLPGVAPAAASGDASSAALAPSNESNDLDNNEQEPWVHRGGLIGDVRRLLSL